MEKIMKMLNDYKLRIYLRKIIKNYLKERWVIYKSYLRGVPRIRAVAIPMEYIL